MESRIVKVLSRFKVPRRAWIGMWAARNHFELLSHLLLFIRLKIKERIKVRQDAIAQLETETELENDKNVDKMV
jgi:hypothetical protein